MLKYNKILVIEIINTIFIIVLGIILHFIFEWSNNNFIVGTISAINESVWEHLKLIFFPMLITTIILYFYEGKNISNYLCAKVLGIIFAMIFTVIFFYTYTGIIGKNFVIVDISSFFVAVILGQYIAYKKMKLNVYCHKIRAVSILILVFLMFLIFTFFPPHINLFKDPRTEGYGIIKE